MSVDGYLDFEPIIPEFTGDMNDDGYVNDLDLNLLLSDYNNGAYNSEDLTSLLNNFGQRPAVLRSGAQSVPEPSGIAMMLIGAAAFAHYALRKRLLIGICAHFQGHHT